MRTFKGCKVFLFAAFAIAAAWILWNWIYGSQWKLNPELASVNEMHCIVRNEDSYESRVRLLSEAEKTRFISAMSDVKIRKKFDSGDRIRADRSKVNAKRYVHIVFLEQAFLDVFVADDGHIIAAEIALWESGDSYSIQNADILKPAIDSIIDYAPGDPMQSKPEPSA